MYALIRKILFLFPPEEAKWLALTGLKLADQLELTRFLPTPLPAPRHIMGLTFSNPIGLAAGLDDNAEYIDALGKLGFGFIEVGGVTPKPQAGNPAPRVFRLTEQNALINRKGFRNKGVEYVAKQLAHRRYKGIVGVNIAKNKDTPNERAVDDYLICFHALWQVADFITINISSPNTPDMRHLQQEAYLVPLLSALKQAQHRIATEHQKYVPLLVKISPDLSDTEIDQLGAIFLKHPIDGIIATNTTIDRSQVKTSAYADEIGGLSGEPLAAPSTAVLKRLHATLQDKIPLIGLGGIMDEASAQAKMQAGASLLQIYTGFIYEGPSLIHRLIRLFSIAAPDISL